MTFWKMQNYGDSKRSVRFPGVWEELGTDESVEHRGFLGWCNYANVIVDKGHFACVKNPQNDTTEWAMNIKYGLYLIIMYCFITYNKRITQMPDVSNTGNGGEGGW